jgi:hypothetical protein
MSDTTPATAVSPFGPLRKREKPPVIPGQRKPTDSIGPRTPFPAAPTRTVPLSHDLVFNRAAYDEAYTAFQRDSYGDPMPTAQDAFAPAAWRDAFGSAA